MISKGNYFGTAHLTAAVGWGVVVLSGADNPSETSPMSNRKRLIYKKDLECISRIKNIYQLTGDEKGQCMQEISMDKVEQAVNELLGD